MKLKPILVLGSALAGAGGLAASAQATPVQSLASSSFEDLLTPPANATELLAASDAALGSGEAKLTLIQDHHHHAVILRPHHHHRPMVVVRPHHHHHHHVVVRRRVIITH